MAQDCLFHGTMMKGLVNEKMNSGKEELASSVLPKSEMPLILAAGRLLGGNVWSSKKRKEKEYNEFHGDNCLLLPGIKLNWFGDF